MGPSLGEDAASDNGHVGDGGASRSSDANETSRDGATSDARADDARVSADARDANDGVADAADAGDPNDEAAPIDAADDVGDAGGGAAGSSDAGDDGAIGRRRRSCRRGAE